MTDADPRDALRLRRIWQVDERTLGLHFTDGAELALDVVALRRACPCAHCVDEWTGEPRLGPDDVPDTVRPVRIRSVGRYALTIGFDDGHDTGIYPFAVLRRMDGRR